MFVMLGGAGSSAGFQPAAFGSGNGADWKVGGTGE